jgi:hypothetical protein
MLVSSSNHLIAYVTSTAHGLTRDIQMRWEPSLQQEVLVTLVQLQDVPSSGFIGSITVLLHARLSRLGGAPGCSEGRQAGVVGLVSIGGCKPNIPVQTYDWEERQWHGLWQCASQSGVIVLYDMWKLGPCRNLQVLTVCEPNVPSGSSV